MEALDVEMVEIAVAAVAAALDRAETALEGIRQRRVTREFALTLEGGTNG